ncbi:uncharacterized protein LOC135699394 [Ochlerotatus camptorhynchus]|uniref:uncharacterized protein LOC135699394 n=1 Tax=Ochlerotatus camptorhynchus TaxID=644619 RepID=UPI0031D47F8A
MNPEQFNLNRNDLGTIVKRHFGNPKLQFKIESPEVAPFSASRVGYLGDHFFLKLKVILDEGKREEDLKLFLKILPTAIPTLTTYLEGIGTFRKEVRLYSDLFPLMGQFTRFAPKAYLAKDDRLLVFENLALEDFRTIGGADMGIFDKAHLEQALKALARFHCASLMLETKTGRSLVELSPGALDENCWILKDANPRVEELENAIQVLCELVKVVEKDNEKLTAILEKMPKFMLQIYDLVKPSDRYRNVACHGDLWGSNLMFKYSEAGLPVDCLIVDFQFARYAPPAYDVNMLITLTTTGDFRKAHYQELIDLYYSAVRQEFIAQCLSPEEIFPERLFRESCARYKVSGMIDNFLMNHVTLLPRNCVDMIFSSPEEYNNFSGDDKIRMCLGVLNNDAKYRARISGIIRDLIEML